MQLPNDFDLGTPFTRDDLKRAGVSVAVLRRREFRQLFRGIWAHEDAVCQTNRIRAALMLHPESAVACRFSAARLHGLPVPEHAFEHILVFDEADRRPHPLIKSHVTQRQRRVTTVQGLRVTDPVETFIDLAGSLGLIDMVVLGDALVKRFRMAPSALVAACERSTAYYAGAALVAALLVRAGVDSPMESRIRLLIVLAGLPEPKVNVILRFEDGAWRFRLDLCYPEVKLVVEYDGRHHESRRDEDLARRAELTEEGYEFVVVTADGYFTTPELTIERVREALVRRGWPAVPDVDDAWRQHVLV
ncbi:endonuclease domain-containing protein [Nocardioides sp. SYSU D00038]|uniref:endonuclease domain-containing protein n=1 Tax=Nocardioides sp. SYSU D00038 TaxID=2812554 RepID=UPI001967CA9E|nr:DUF559 domain-containing protein [Nocardioides sp. SYSU D00038]